MRSALALALALAALAACTPDIVSGAYLCGPEGLCPEGQACNGPDNRCVLPGEVQAFACGAMAFDPPGDDAPDTGTLLLSLPCASVPTSTEGCLDVADDRDFYQLDVAAECTAARLEVSASFPIAFQPLGLVLSMDGAAPAPADAPCPASSPPSEGHDVRCLSQPVQAGHRYAVGVVRDGAADCGGGCRHNRYTLRLRLATP